MFFDHILYSLRIKKMAIPNNAKREIPPTHPGEMLREDFTPGSELNMDVQFLKGFNPTAIG